MADDYALVVKKGVLDVIIDLVLPVIFLNIKVINVGSDNFGNPIFQEGLQN